MRSERDSAGSDALLDIRHTAAAWLSRRDGGMNAAETAELIRWLEQDPRHAAAFEELADVWGSFDGLRTADREQSHEFSSNRSGSQGPSRRSSVRKLAWAVGAIAAMLVIILIPRKAPHSAETLVGAFQKLDLPDGSVAQLNTDSAVDVEFTATERHVRIARGEVFFKVQKDAARPFVVSAGPVSVRAIGTAFNVRRRAGAVEVLVTEGKVRVDESRGGRSLLPETTPDAGLPVLVGGERASIPVSNSDVLGTHATIEKVPLQGAQRLLAWQEQRLEFENAPLREVIEEFNRYNETKIVSEDPALSASRFSGAFRSNGLEAFVMLLEENFGARAVRSAGKIYLSPRSP